MFGDLAREEGFQVRTPGSSGTVLDIRPWLAY